MNRGVIPGSFNPIDLMNREKQDAAVRFNDNPGRVLLFFFVIAQKVQQFFIEEMVLVGTDEDFRVI